MNVPNIYLNPVQCKETKIQRQNNITTETNCDTFSLSNKEGNNKWKIFPSKENDPINYKKNKQELKEILNTSFEGDLSHLYMLKNSDIHVLVDDDGNNIIVAFKDGCITRIGDIDHKQFEKLKEHSKELGLKMQEHPNAKELSKINPFLMSCNLLSSCFGFDFLKLGHNAADYSSIDTILQMASDKSEEIKKAKDILGKSIELKTVDDAEKVLNYFGYKTERNNDGLTVYSQGYVVSANHDRFSTYDIDSEKLKSFVTNFKLPENYTELKCEPKIL